MPSQPTCGLLIISAFYDGQDQYGSICISVPYNGGAISCISPGIESYSPIITYIDIINNQVNISLEHQQSWGGSTKLIYIK